MGLTLAELPSGDLVQHVGERRTLLIDGDGVVSVLVLSDRSSYVR